MVTWIASLEQTFLANRVMQSLANITSKYLGRMEDWVRPYFAIQHTKGSGWVFTKHRTKAVMETWPGTRCVKGWQWIRAVPLLLASNSVQKNVVFFGIKRVYTGGGLRQVYAKPARDVLCGRGAFAASLFMHMCLRICLRELQHILNVALPECLRQKAYRRLLPFAAYAGGFLGLRAPAKHRRNAFADFSGVLLYKSLLPGKRRCSNDNEFVLHLSVAHLMSVGKFSVERVLILFRNDDDFCRPCKRKYGRVP